MNFCTNCGVELGQGRFCTNCGTPVPVSPGTGAPAGRPDDTVERPAVQPPPPPSNSRYPLFADQVTAPPVPPTTADSRRGEARGRTPWILLLVVGMVAAAATGVWLATRGTQSATPEPDETGSPTELPDSGQPIDLAPHTRAAGPAPVAPGVDLAGNSVPYPVSNLLDDDTQTAYRLPGDASGSVITFRLPQAATISEVGLINGYAKVDTVGGRTVDWYTRNRRVLRVEWRFDDGTTVVQDLRQVPQLQSIDIDPELTQTVELRLVEVSAPGSGPLRKNVTAISDVLLLGS